MKVERRVFAVECAGSRKAQFVSQEFRDLLADLHDKRIHNSLYGKPILVQDGSVIVDGQVVDQLNCDSKIQLLWQEYHYQTEAVAH